MVDLRGFTEAAERWLSDHADRRPPKSDLKWGEGSDVVATLPTFTHDEERGYIDRSRAWQRAKSDAGYGAITYPPEYGGSGLPASFDQVFRRLERQYITPPVHDAVAISLDIEAPTILALGSTEQKSKHVESLRRADTLCCQLFSEPGAGSDLGSISTSAVRDGDEWVVDGQKVWTSGARHADFGWLIARTDPTSPRQQAFTGFIVDMRSPGIEVRPLRQMTGGSTFCEVFFTDVRVSDSDRVGEIGTGWGAAMTTLGFERASTPGGEGGPSMFDRLLLLARHEGRCDDPVVRQELMNVYIDSRLRVWTNSRSRARLREGGVPGPEGSIAKLARTNSQQRVSHLASKLLGARVLADTSEWGTYAWTEYILAQPAGRIGGGTDEIQRNTIGERALGLPREPR